MELLPEGWPHCQVIKAPLGRELLQLVEQVGLAPVLVHLKAGGSVRGAGRRRGKDGAYKEDRLG